MSAGMGVCGDDTRRCRRRSRRRGRRQTAGETRVVGDSHVTGCRASFVHDLGCFAGFVMIWEDAGRRGAGSGEEEATRSGVNSIL